MFVIQTKVDTKGEAYARALQHILTGVYLSELCLIGLFGVRKASGPSTLIVILFVGTIVYHIALNRHLKPLEQYLPPDLQPEDEETPLLVADDESAPDVDQPESRIRRVAHGRVPEPVLNPVAQFLEPHVFETHHTLKSWFEDPEDEPPTYKDEDLRTAYLNPALTSKTPKLWLVKDEMGVSRREIEENEAAEIPSTDDGAFLDEKNNIGWSVEDFSKVPIFKMPVRY